MADGRFITTLILQKYQPIKINWGADIRGPGGLPVDRSPPENDGEPVYRVVKSLNLDLFARAKLLNLAPSYLANLWFQQQIVNARELTYLQAILAMGSSGARFR